MRYHKLIINIIIIKKIGYTSKYQMNEMQYVLIGIVFICLHSKNIIIIRLYNEILTAESWAAILKNTKLTIK